MDIDALTAFLAVHDTNSFSAAAQQLHLSQPAVSKRIALLEDGLQCRLFDRVGRQVALTPAGRELYPRALSILREVSDTRRAMKNMIGSVTGRLSLATSHHIGLWRLPPVLKRYSQNFPEVSLDLHFMDSDVAYTEVLRGELEFAVVTLAPGQRSRVVSLPVWDDPLAFMCAPDHPLSEFDQVTMTDLSHYPAVLPDDSTFTGRIVTELFQRRQTPLQTLMSTNYLETIRMLVRVGLGWSVLPRSMADRSTCILSVSDASITRTLGVIYHEQRTLSNAGQAFVDLLRQEPDASGELGTDR
ncbi:MAG: LysR family transcriptional regulator [Proteobacteria bacterium]|jgi:DNA-binding transcriptional LysR family regulator|nr:LysR family transcriptional regulator [Pseudomonadota bacterium]MDA1299280.1 LysR family transcriptional regulator [Pseudomonadota bacterium]